MTATKGKTRSRVRQSPVPASPVTTARSRPAWLGVVGWAGCAAVALGHAVVLTVMSPSGSVVAVSLDWLVVMVPALVTLAVLPSTIRHWRRWAVFAGVLFIADPMWILPTLVIAETWVLHKEWVDERPAGELERLLARVGVRRGGRR